MSPSKKQRAKQKRLFKLSLPMLHQLIAYAEWAAEDGTYYGREVHFRQRHGRIMKWLLTVRQKRIGV